MQLGRLFEMVHLLLNNKSMTAKELAAHFEVSTRTIYRDMEVLSQAGIPIYACKGSGGGIRLSERFVLDKSLLSKEEQEKILASLHGLCAVSSRDVQPTLQKLSALFRMDNTDWIEIDFSKWNAHHPVNKRFSILKNAILSRQVVAFQYSGMDGQTQLRTVEPVKLLFRGMDWYLSGWCRMREAYRSFKLTRMDTLSVTEETFVPKPAVASERLPDYPMKAPKINLVVKIDSDMAYRVRDEFSLEQREETSDGFLIRFQMPDNDWLYQYLMTYGNSLTVLEPQGVRVKLVNRLRETLHRYGI